MIFIMVHINNFIQYGVISIRLLKTVALCYQVNFLFSLCFHYYETLKHTLPNNEQDFT
jgi:hypothetical protein